MALPLIAAAALVAGGSIMGGISGNKAAHKQRVAAADAERRFEAGKNEAQGYMDPYAGSGQTALNPLTALLTGQTYNPDSGETQRLTDDQRMSSFLKSPGYQFRLSEGLRSIEKSQAARGNLLSGGGMKELETYGQGMASDEYGNYINQLMGLAGIGQQADMAKGNWAMGTAAQMGNAAYQGGMGGVDASKNMSNFGFGLAGMGASMMGGGSGGGMAGMAAGASSSAGTAGRYNPSYIMNSMGGS